MSNHPRPILTQISDRSHFKEILSNNPGLIIIKFGAEWCQPCKRIKEQVNYYFERMPNNVQCMVIDIDECFDVYAFLKSKKMVNGIPVLLCYNKGNVGFIPDDSVTGTDNVHLNQFFERCVEAAR